MRHQEKVAIASSTPQTGWWFKIKSAVLEQPPRLRGFGSCASSLESRSNPHGQAQLSKLAESDRLKATTVMDFKSSHPSGVRFGAG